MIFTFLKKSVLLSPADEDLVVSIVWTFCAFLSFNLFSRLSCSLRFTLSKLNKHPKDIAFRSLCVYFILVVKDSHASGLILPKAENQGEKKGSKESNQKQDTDDRRKKFLESMSGSDRAVGTSSSKADEHDGICYI
jgi:hypothetical protein